MVAESGMTAQTRPMEGLYTASVVPTMKPPPTQVAVKCAYASYVIYDSKNVLGGGDFSRKTCDPFETFGGSSLFSFFMCVFVKKNLDCV